MEEFLNYLEEIYINLAAERDSHKDKDFFK